jgi:hypothetical protein
VSRIELHADFDRDGRLTRSATERAARASWPGAIVVPNMDRDRRRLPVSVTDARVIAPDYELVSAVSGDDELVPIEIVVVNGALVAGDTLHLRCSGVIHTRIRLSDDTGRVVPHGLRAPEVYELPPMPASGVLSLTLQVRTIAGAAFGPVSNLGLGFGAGGPDESRFMLTLLRRDASGTERVEDEGRFSVAPFVLVDRMAPVRRMYMVRSPSNVPSVADVRRVTRAARVPLVEVEESLTGGDTWIQDQYQHGMMQGPNGWTELILHLPRLRHENSDATITDNLEDVVNSHFRSRDIGLFRDLWARVVPVRTEDGSVARPTFRDLEALVKRVERLEVVTGLFNRYGYDANKHWRPSKPRDWVHSLLTLESELARLSETLEEARTGASAQRDRQLVDEKRAAGELVKAVMAQLRAITRADDPVIESDLAGQPVRLRATIVQQLLDRASQMHASQNYGGNFESTPPVGQAQLGAIIVGNVTDAESNAEVMDPDLLRVFAKQQKQPIVEIDTTWLKVGHVDEMLAVVPSSRAAGGFAVLHASSSAAVELLERARRRHLLGLPVAHPARVSAGGLPSGVMPRLMIDGSAPVTRLFRGKAWLHIHPPATYNEVAPYQDPPKIYLQLCRAFGTTTDDSGYSTHKIGYVPGEGEDRRYPADITAIELLWAEADGSAISSNRAYDTYLLEPSRAILRGALPGVAILPVPVLFDRTRDTAPLRGDRGEVAKTSAVTPDMVNMQVLNGNLLVPRPYGPRMRLDDAIAVVREAMTALGVPASIKARVGRRLIAARRMTRGEYWVERVDPAAVTSRSGLILASYGGMRTSDDVIAAFRDSFPGADAAERERRIIEPNRRHFDGQGWLREDFSLLRIDDGMVDLLELWVAAIAAELAVRLHFVDSWFYHVRDGQIHCATNVLHAQPLTSAGLPNVWDARDHAFRVTTVEIEDEVLEGAGHR